MELSSVKLRLAVFGSRPPDLGTTSGLVIHGPEWAPTFVPLSSSGTIKMLGVTPLTPPAQWSPSSVSRVHEHNGGSIDRGLGQLAHPIILHRTIHAIGWPKTFRNLDYSADLHLDFQVHHGPPTDILHPETPLHTLATYPAVPRPFHLRGPFVRPPGRPQSMPPLGNPGNHLPVPPPDHHPPPRAGHFWVLNNRILINY